MLVSYNWVKEFFPNLTLNANDLAEAITRTGIEIEGVDYLDAELKNLVVGEVKTCEKHPSADKLNKTTVLVDNEETVQIICGAPNVAAGQKVIVARVGARLPGGMKIKRAKLRGEVSEGMICSLQELGFSSSVVPKAYQDGIFVLPDDVVVGSNAVELLGLNDAILDLAITPNRADALSMTGVAHEVGAITHTKPELPQQPDVSETGGIEGRISVKIQDVETTPYYAVRMVEDIEIKDSPLWLQVLLMKSGIRPHSNVVDVTNYINLLYGQPLHAFDYEKIGSKEIVVRLATKDEEIITLDGQKRTLNDGHTVITNGKEPIAIAGIMGGESSEVSEATNTVLLEGAIFSSDYIGRASRELGIRTEASIRYDKGSDAFKVEQALAHGAALIALLSNGKMISGSVEEDNRDAYKNVVTTTLSRVNRLLGTTISHEEVQVIFDRLAFDVTISGDDIEVKVPSRRWDISIEADILEEIARIYGYDNIPVTLPETATAGGLTTSQMLKRELHDTLQGAGLNQALTYSLTSEKEATRLALSKESVVSLKMPMSEERSKLRTSILPGLLHAASYNVARKNTDVALYEIGNVFYGTEGDALPLEEEHLAGLMTGNRILKDWQKETKAVDFFVIKGILELLNERLGLLEPFRFEQMTREDMHPGRTAKVYLGDLEIGFIGQIHPALQKEYDLKETYVFELNLREIIQAEKVHVAYQPIPRYPEMTRDVAILVSRDTAQSAILDVIRENGGKLLHDVQLFDIFEGEGILDNQKSMAYTLTYLDPERTLVEEEVTAINQKVLDALTEKLGAVIR
ncbi:phenylalanine--tRNA ligase subunit beta [Listeria fleischmannii]|uniref:phenylalanine--tRNA ligase subunit beta n=1 Tax=Listeria fleischmannii TaxID=1069827 RepID=UPI00162462E4|nr:phenylalanine--tRNA ligase subunit beta [Listeria fleischmannii]MBC1419384.1 phenylalanine--tRNA ligase subunit beta [Listeria fleischmannii]